MAFRFSSLTVRRALAGVALTGVIALGACGGSDSSGPSGDVYALFSVDAQNLPIVITDYNVTGDVFTIKSGSLSLKTNGTYTVRITQTYKESPSATLQTVVTGENGTYVTSGSTITTTSTHDFENGTLTASSGDVTVATKSGTTITADAADGSTYIFKK